MDGCRNENTIYAAQTVFNIYTALKLSFADLYLAMSVAGGMVGSGWPAAVRRYAASRDTFMNIIINKQVLRTFLH